MKGRSIITMTRKHTTKTSVIASLGLAGIATAAGLGGQQVQAHADNTTGVGSTAVANAPENPTVKQYPNKSIIDNTVNQAKDQEGLTINKTPDQTLNANNQKDAENQSKTDYQNQAQKINQAKDQAKQQMDSYHSDHDQWVKEKQKYDQDLAKYNQDKAENEQKNKEIDSNNAEIDRKNAENKANYDKAMGVYNQAKANIDANNKKIDEDNAKAQADYNAAKAKYDQDKAKYDQDLAKYNTAKQKYASDDSAYQAAKAKYDQDKAKYDQKLSEYNKNADYGNKNGLSSIDFAQHLVLGKSHDARYSVEIIANRKPDRQDKYDSSSDWLTEFTDSTEATNLYWNSGNGVDGNVARVTYTNLNPNNKYTDKNGNVHKIAKIVRTISNLGADSQWTPIDGSVSHIRIFNDPTDGVQYSSNVTVHDDYYDENDNKINIDGNAYITLASLNNSVSGDSPETVAEHLKNHNDDWHVEGASTPSKKIYTLIGSSVTVHDDGWAYADKNNGRADGSGGHSTWTNPTYWDNANKHADLMYYGAAVANATDNGGTTVMFSYWKHPGDHPSATDGEAWATIDTTIPNTPFNEQKPVPPTPPTPFTTPEPQKPTQPTAPTINPHDQLDIQPPVMTPDTPHQNNIPFTETPPTPPREEPQAPNPVNVDYHYNVYNYNSNVQKNFTLKSGQVTNNQVFVNGSTIYAQITGELPNASEMSDPLTVFTVNDDASQYASKAKFGGATVLVDGQDHTGDFTVTDRGNGQITISLKNLSLAQGQSFVIMPHWTINQDAELGPLTNKASVVTNGVEQGATPVTVTNYTPSIHKDIDLGEVQGDQGISVDGQTVANGTILTFPLTFKDPLPANRNQDIVSTIWNDTLDSHYQYQSYKAYLTQDGKLVDVTEHVKLTQNGQQLHWEDDDYLRNYYNNNKASQPTMPIIDLTVKVIGDNVKLIPNQFDITQIVQNSDGIVDLKTSSNTVHVSTYQPETHKDVELGEVDGDTPESVDGKTVVAGSVITFPMTISDLPANRSQNVASTTWTDILNPNIEYHGYRAFLPDTNGQLKDVSSMIHVQQNGQTLTITDDQQLRDLINDNKSQAQKQVILDIYGIVKETSQVIPNVFTVKQTFSNPDGTNPTGTSSTSNKVTVNVYKAQPVKDVQVGNVTGSDSSKSINGKMVADGQSVTFPLTVKNSLPANRSQKVIKTVWRDTLDRNLKYTGFNAVLNVNGKDTSVKEHIHVEQMGRTLIFTADDYLNNLLNSDLTKAQAQPIIDVYAEMTGTAKTATNVYQFEQRYTDGNGNVMTKTESNKVTVTTPQAPQPKKSVTDGQGHDITGKETKAGQTYEYHLNWDLSKYAHIVATDDMINKGFFFIDPIDTNAIELGDLSKATVTDSRGNVVPNMTIKAFHSISELPQYMQKEIRDNHLESQLGSTFLVALANNPKEFYKNYVQTGQSLRVNFPYRVKPGFVGTYKNTAWQFGFGHATPTNTVTNFVRPVPKATPQPTSSPVPAQQQAPRLPQTGNDQSIVPVIFGLSMFITAAGYGIFRLLLALGLF